jgi:hypothetical protein
MCGQCCTSSEVRGGLSFDCSACNRSQAAQEAHRAELQREKQHYEDLLSRARTSQVNKAPHESAASSPWLSQPPLLDIMPTS